MSVSGVVLAGAGGAAGIIVPPTTTPANALTIYVQSITVNIKTSAAQSITFQDNASTPIVVNFIEASAAAGVTRTINFGARGFALTLGKQLDISGVAGPAYSYSVEAYADGPALTQATTSDRSI